MTDAAALPRIGGEPRDIQLERRITAEAAGYLHADPELVGDFGAFAEQRAPDAPVRNLHVRDFKTEIREELADTRNYFVWWVQQVRAHGDHQTAEQILRVFADVIHPAIKLELLPSTRSIHA